MKKYIIYSIFIIIWLYNYKIAFSELDKFNDSFEISNSQPTTTTSSSSSWWGWYSWTQYQKDNPKEIETTTEIKTTTIENNVVENEEIELNSAPEEPKTTKSSWNNTNIDKTTEVNEDNIDNNYWNIWKTYVDPEILDGKISIDDAAEDIKLLPKTWTQELILIILSILITSFWIIQFKRKQKTPN